MTSSEICLGDFYPARGESVDPSRYKDETFELFSIPAYDRGEADELSGSEIGSSKKRFYPNDVLLSRIVPHIRRCWIVPKRKELRQIGSGEWIVFRSQNLYPGFLRYYLLSDLFNSKFMSTVKGIGGSLLRADPKQVGKFKIPLPSLDEQQKIASILDAADELRQQDKALIAKYDELTQSLFLDMFGNPFLNSKGFQMCNLGEQVSKVQIGPFGSQLHKHDYIEGGVPLINPTHIYDKKVIPDYSFSINEDKYNELTNYHLKEDDLIMGRRGEMGRCALITSNENGWFCGTGSLFIRPSKSINPSFLLFLMSSVDGVDYLEHEAKGVTMKNLNKGIIERIQFGLPSINSQDLFADRVNLIASQKVTAQKCLNKSEALFDSLLQKAFKGELTN